VCTAAVENPSHEARTSRGQKWTQIQTSQQFSVKKNQYVQWLTPSYGRKVVFFLWELRVDDSQDKRRASTLEVVINLASFCALRGDNWATDV
jgi:hypothetical protein